MVHTGGFLKRENLRRSHGSCREPPANTRAVDETWLGQKRQQQPSPAHAQKEALGSTGYQECHPQGGQTGQGTALCTAGQELQPCQPNQWAMVSTRQKATAPSAPTCTGTAAGCAWMCCQDLLAAQRRGELMQSNSFAPGGGEEVRVSGTVRDRPYSPGLSTGIRSV